MPEFLTKTEIDCPREFAFRWHQSPHAFERLSPPWERIELVEKQGSIDTGSVTIRNWVGPFSFRLKAQHSQFVKDEQFYDEMSGGPFRKWQHWHKFDSIADRTCLTDEIQYTLRGGGLGQLVAGGMVRRRLQQMFAYRHQVTRSEIEDHFRYRDQSPKTIAVTGATGLVGRSVCEFLIGGGHQVIRLNRSGSTATETRPCWNPETGKVNFGEGVSQVDSVIHLAGYGIAERRWNARVKEKIGGSRIEPTNKLATFLEKNNSVRESFICASATGIYGNRPDEEVLNENSAAGEGFLAETCVPWEAACEPLRSAGIRTVNMRFGIILSARGGALKSMLLPFRIGAGGPVGNGRQVWSWISHFDTVRAIHFAVMNQEIDGPVNYSSPTPVTQRQFAKTLGKVLFRPSFMPLPAFAAKLVLGEMATYLLLYGCRVVPEKLTECGFQFVHNNLEQALRFELGRMKIEP